MHYMSILLHKHHHQTMSDTSVPASQEISAAASEISVSDVSLSEKSSCIDQIANQTNPHYVLYVFVGDLDDEELIQKYKQSFDERSARVMSYVNGEMAENFDAGIDIYTPTEMVALGNGVMTKINTGLKCAMFFSNDSQTVIPSGFHMYPRSSTGSSTPLRLANSVGIIDSGYRGNLIGCFDNYSQNDYKIEKYQRLLQICSPNLTYPIIPILVTDKVNGLNNVSSHIKNHRGEGGFGSTGM